MDDAFKRLEELVAVPAKKKQARKPLTPEQKARGADRNRKWRAENMEKKLELDRKWRAENREKLQAKMRKMYEENREKYIAASRNRAEKKTADPELFAINQADFYARSGKVPRDITTNCPEPTRSKLQALVDKIKADPSAGKQVVGLLRNMSELRKLELAEMKQATEETKE